VRCRPLIHLDELNCLDLLADFPAVLVPPAVWREVMRHRPQALREPGWWLRETAPAAEEPAVLTSLARVLTLHDGEREALRLALEYSPVIILTNDTAARLAAGNLGLRAQGTIGLIVRSIRRLLRSKEAAITLLRDIPVRSTLHLKRTLLETVIREVERSA